MGKRSKSRSNRRQVVRYESRADSSDDRLNWFLLRWDDQWGRPPLIVVVGLWLFNGSLAATLLVFSLMLFYGASQAANEGPIEGLVVLLLSGGLAAASFFIFRPVWRAQSYYSSFPSSTRDIPSERDPPASPVELTLTEIIQPHTVQCDRLIAACHETLACHYSLRQVSDKELPRHEKFLRNVVNPAVEGQIDLLDACEIGHPPYRLTYAVVSYRHEYPSGRSSVIEQRVGQLVMLTLACNIGRLWIRPETMSDKLVQWWGGDDLDFADHPQFSHRYHCQSDNPTLVLLRVPDAVWQAIGQHTAIIVRAQGTNAVVAKEEPLDPEHSVDVVQLGFELLAAFEADAEHQRESRQS